MAYIFHRNRGRLKAAAVARFLGGMSAEALAESAERFAVENAQSLFRPDAVQTWRKWRAEGAVSRAVRIDATFGCLRLCKSATN